MELPRTILHVLHDRASKVPDRPALWTRRHGYYLPLSWRDYEARVKQLALGLLELGLEPGGTLPILGFNREEWLVADLAAMAVGGVPVGVYVTSSPEQLHHILSHCQAQVALVENEKYLSRLMQVWDRLPRLKHVLVMDPPASLPHRVLAYQEVLARGQGKDERLYWDRLNALEPDGLATLIYTSGTTGLPKGVMISHRNLCWTAQQLCTALGAGAHEVLLSYLPLSHVAEQLASLHGALLAGMQVYFAESMERLIQNLKEVRPTVFFGVPRVWEKLAGRAEAALADLPPYRARLLGWARKATTDALQRQLAHERVPNAIEAQHQLAQRLVHTPLKERMGFDRTRIFVSAAAPISKRVLDFFLSLDIVIREIYGQSEGTGPTSVNSQDATRPGTAGRPMLGVEVRIADDGEILVRGQNVCLGYYRDPEATAELLRDGWLHSGDLGELDAEGFLRVTGRKKEIIVTSGGKKTDPANIEALLDRLPPLANAMVVGEGRNYLTALLPVDPERVPVLAKAHGWPEEPQALIVHPEFLAWLDDQIEREVNQKVSRFEKIRRYHLLPHGFTVEGGELTPTLKLRRNVVEEKYADVIRSLYATSRDRTHSES